MIKNMKLGVKMYSGFLAVVLIFGAICLYQILEMGELSNLQDEGAGRAEDALAVKDVVERMAAVYPVFADGIINRNLAETKENFAAARQTMEQDTATVKDLVDTAEEETLAAQFAASYKKYMDLYETGILTILEKEEDALQRSRDAIHVMEIGKNLDEVYPVIADSIINRDLGEARSELTRIKKTMQEDIRAVNELVDTPQEKEWAREFGSAYNEFISVFENDLLPSLSHDLAGTDWQKTQALDGELDTLRNTALGLLQKIDSALEAEMDAIVADEHTIREVDGQLDRIRDEVIAPLAQINQALHEGSVKADEHFDQVSKTTVRIAEIVAVLGIILAAAIAYVLTRSITTPVTKTVKMLEEMEKGHLEMRLNLDSGDEIGQMARTMDAFADSLQNEMVEALQKLAANDLTFDATPKDEQDAIRNALKKAGADLNDIMAQMNVAGDQVASASGQVSSASQSLSQGATEQASSLEEITSSMTEMASQTKINAENANQANQLAGQARSAADKGNHQMQEMVAAMAEINEAGQNISKIIKVIDEIAFQTNLLALNAAVEAARAGRHGKGFAVVAEEVRNLAARSAQAARETAELIEGSVAKTENGSAIANQTAEALAEIVGGISKVTDLVGEIAAASSEQAQGIAQVNEGLGQIDQVTQQNTANAEESAAAAEELSAQASQLQGMLARFILKGGTGRAIAPPPRTATPFPAANGWGDAQRRETTRATSPSKMITLDDSEFGKY